MRILFRTNLDEAKSFVHGLNYGHDSQWTSTFGVPRVGEEIEFRISRHRAFSLRVCAVMYAPSENTVNVELHLPTHFRSILEWMEWFKQHARGE